MKESNRLSNHVRALAPESQEIRPDRSRWAKQFTLAALAVGLSAGLFATGCTGIKPDVPAQGVSQPSGPVVLREGDVVKLLFPASPEYNNSQKIRTDGKLSLPLIGEVQAAGKTVGALQSDLSGRYKSQLTTSEVVVTLESAGAAVIVSGGVASPGKFVFDRPTTLLEAVMGAGGFTDFARKRQVRLIRVVNGRYVTETYDLSRGLTGGSVPVVYVRGGDVIHIPISNW